MVVQLEPGQGGARRLLTYVFKKQCVSIGGEYIGAICVRAAEEGLGESRTSFRLLWCPMWV